MADEIEGIEKDPRVESLYAASQKSPGLCDVRGGYHDPSQPWADDDCNVSLAEDLQD